MSYWAKEEQGPGREWLWRQSAIGEGGGGSPGELGIEGDFGGMTDRVFSGETLGGHDLGPAPGLGGSYPRFLFPRLAPALLPVPLATTPAGPLLKKIKETLSHWLPDNPQAQPSLLLTWGTASPHIFAYRAF